jgi:cytochrome c553
MKTGISCVLGLLLVALHAHVTAATPDQATEQAAARKAVELCSACHGPGGVSISPTFPQLAGQQEEYLQSQMEALKARKRADPDAHDFMWGIAALLDDKMIAGLAHYYASQSPPRGQPGDPALTAKGKELYDKGNPSKNIPACNSCHGADAAGMGQFPRLAGQHAAYTVKQLTVIQSALRAAPVMHGIVKDMSKEEMAAVAAYLQSR